MSIRKFAGCFKVWMRQECISCKQYFKRPQKYDKSLHVLVVWAIGKLFSGHPEDPLIPVLLTHIPVKDKYCPRYIFAKTQEKK
jgi:hypothetical protein